MAADPYRYFRSEARELSDQLLRDVLDLEKGEGDPGAVERILRAAHTLKGAARVVKQVEVAEHAHAIESALVPFRSPETACDRASIAGVLQHLDELARRIADLPAPAASEQSKQPRGDVATTVRAEILDLEALLSGVMETHRRVTALSSSLALVERARGLVEGLAGELDRRAARGDAGPAALPRSTVEELASLCGVAGRRIASAVDGVARELRGVREVSEGLRLVPVGSTFTALERTARDAAEALGKSIKFEARGGEIRLEGHLVEAVKDALVQTVRNAVVHGIEPEPERLAAGKGAAGQILVKVARRGREVAFLCRDDGRGVDLAAVRRAAARLGAPAMELAGRNAEDLLDALLARRGLTTATTVTELAGRGVGLAIVVAAAEALGGHVRATSERGRGTTFELRVPLRIAGMKALVIEAGSERVTLPLDAVRRAARFESRAILPTADGEAVSWEGAVVPYLPLATVLGGKDAPAAGPRSAVLVETSGDRVALGVDRFHGTSSVVVLPLPESAAASPAIAGASLDSEGRPRLALDPDGLGVVARRRRVPDASPAPQLPILVVDDSLTTRMLVASILESAGYEVELATSGEEGIEAAHRSHFGLFLVDVEMPGMDGYTFIERTRADARLRHTPAILVTSRASAEDRRRGEQVGAAGFVAKGEFDQAALLERIRNLMS